MRNDAALPDLFFAGWGVQSLQTPTVSEKRQRRKNRVTK